MDKDQVEQFLGHLPPPPATDLEWMTDWADTIQQIVYRGPGPGGVGAAVDPALTRQNGFQFRPHPSVLDALIRLEARFPQAVRQIDQCRQEAELFYRRWEARDFPDPGEDDYENLAGALQDLLLRIRSAIEIMATKPEPPAAVAERADRKTDKAKIRLPKNPDVLALARKIDRERQNGSSMEEIALDFAEGNAQRAKNLLRQLRPDRYGHLLQ